MWIKGELTERFKRKEFEEASKSLGWNSPVIENIKKLMLTKERYSQKVLEPFRILLEVRTMSILMQEPLHRETDLKLR